MFVEPHNYVSGLVFHMAFLNSFILVVFLYYVLQKQTSVNGNFEHRLGPSL